MPWSGLERKLFAQLPDEGVHCDDSFRSIRRAVEEEYPSLERREIETVIVHTCADVGNPSPKEEFVETLHFNLERSIQDRYPPAFGMESEQPESPR